ncbi:hypothetical protein LEA_19823, partial [human gut metagenome]
MHFVEAKCSVSEIVKGEVNRAGLHAKIAEPHPIFYKYNKTGQEVYVSLNLSNTMLTGIGKGTITREDVSADY